MGVGSVVREVPDKALKELACDLPIDVGTEQPQAVDDGVDSTKAVEFALTERRTYGR